MAQYTDFGIPGTNPGILMPKLKNRFLVEFINMGGVTDSVTTAQVIISEKPKIQYEEIVLDRYNSKAWIAGKHTWSPLTITFEDDLGNGVTDVLKKQQEIQQHLIAPEAGAFLGTAAAGEDYKFMAKLKSLDGDYNNTVAVETWNLYGSWIQNVDYGDNDYAANETNKIILTLRYDHATQETNNTYSGAKATGHRS